MSARKEQIAQPYEEMCGLREALNEKISEKYADDLDE